MALLWTHQYRLGALMMQMGRLDSARTLLTNASEQLHRLGRHHFEVQAHCNLGLLYHLAGEYARAQAELTQVLTSVQSYGDLRFEALASTRLGYALEALQLPDKARSMYERGQLLHERMGQHFYALNAVAGLARLAAQQGEQTKALAHVQTIWDTIRGQSTDATVETARTLCTCYTIFHNHDHPRAAAVLDTACAQLRGRAAAIDDPVHVAQFWQLADHHFFHEHIAQNN